MDIQLRQIRRRETIRTLLQDIKPKKRVNGFPKKDVYILLQKMFDLYEGDIEAIEKELDSEKQAVLDGQKKEKQLLAEIKELKQMISDEEQLKY